jgi:sensor c-di-GMP phosphodiesterase-like protein
MQIPKRHLFTTLAAMIVVAACGALVGYWLARCIAARTAESLLEHYASRLMSDEESTFADLRTVLAAVSASKYRPCSNADMEYFRALILASDYLKDAGRMRDGKIECSATLGRSPQPSGQLIPDFTQRDGSTIYRSLAAYQKNGLKTVAMQQSGWFVAFTPLTHLHLEPAPMHYTGTIADALTHVHGQLLGEPIQASAPILTEEGRVRLGDNLYATRCSTRFFFCITAYTSIPEVMQANRTRYVAFTVLFRLLGGLTGLAFSLLYFRYQSVEQQLRRAILRDELCLVYQPIVRLTSRQMRGAEALARWTNKKGVAVSPEVFIKIAEKYGFVDAITRLVVRHALRDFGEILRSHPWLRLSINATATDLADIRFLPMLDRSLQEAGVPARSLAIEITESSTVMRGLAIETIHSLRERGYSVHIDDFGTGYSSLSYLRDLSVDAIKIDKTFTQTIGTGSVIVAILPQILSMAETFNLEVIVEGIETEEQARYFDTCALPLLAQGWLFGYPVPAEEFHRLLAEDQKKCLITAN